LVDVFLDFKPLPFDSDQTTDWARGVQTNHIVGEHEPLPTGGNILGFEVTSFHFGHGHSWLCSGLERDMHELFGIRPNSYGLIDSYEEAKKAYQWIAEDKLQGTRAEPEPYYPWLIVQYPLH
jgi:hypothetical protein